MFFKRWLILVLVSTFGTASRAQDVDSLLNKTELSFQDSLNIFKLIDSLMTMDDVQVGSQLAVRFNYNSNVLSAGRTLGIEQFGLSPGLSYYHKSGAYADVSAYWSHDVDPNFYLTTVSAGYMHVFTRSFSVIGSYDHYFYNFKDDNYIPYSNAFTLSPYWEFKFITLRLDYSYYFGDAKANRLLPAVGFNIKKKKLLGLDKISFYPAFYMLVGDETFSQIEFAKPKSVREAIDNLKKYGTRFSIVEKETTVFGVMNYAFSFPLTLSFRNWMFNLTYTYNIPKALDGEYLTLPESGFISSSLIYYIDFTRKNKTL